MQTQKSRQGAAIRPLKQDPKDSNIRPASSLENKPFVSEKTPITLCKTQRNFENLSDQKSRLIPCPVCRSDHCRRASKNLNAKSFKNCGRDLIIKTVSEAKSHKRATSPFSLRCLGSLDPYAGNGVPIDLRHTLGRRRPHRPARWGWTHLGAHRRRRSHGPRPLMYRLLRLPI